MSAASMSLKTIAASLLLYLKNRREKELMQQRVKPVKWPSVAANLCILFKWTNVAQCYSYLVGITSMPL